MSRRLPILALVMIAIGVVGLIAVGCGTLVNPFNSGHGGGMMGRGGMMGGQGYGIPPTINSTPVPANQPIDREVKIVARGIQFEPTRVAIKRGETVKFTLVNQDAVAHNFESQDAEIAYTFLPANSTQSVVWAAPREAGTFTALCTFHAGMQIQIVVE